MSITLSIFLVLITTIVFAAAPEDIETLYQRMALLEKQILDLRNQYNLEKQNNDRRLVRIQEEKSKGNTEIADRELKEGYASAERLNKLNVLLNEKQQQIENVCKNWRLSYGPAVDALLENAEKEKNAKKKAEIGSKLQNYQSLNSQLCVQTANTGSTEWKNLHVEAYDGPQEINQKVQLLKDISREISIQLTRLDEQHKQLARERRTRDRAQEFIEEGTLFEGGVNVRTRATSGITTSGDGGPTISSPGPVENPGVSPPPENNSGDAATTGAPDASSSTEWHRSSDFPKTESDYKKQRSELVQQQEELHKKIQEFEAKQRALVQP